MKYSIQNILIFSFLTFFLTACREHKTTFNYSGGELSFPISSAPASWVPSMAYDINSFVVLNQVYESLVEIDQLTYQIKPLLAKKFTYSDDFTLFTFELEKEVRFHPSSLFPEDSKSAFLTNEDVIKTFEYACSKDNKSSSYAYQNILKEIKGAEDFHRELVDSIQGLRIEDSLIVIELKHSDPLFLQKIASPALGIFSAKWLSKKQGIPPGTGPFYFGKQTANLIQLIKNPHYFKTSAEHYSLPYLDKINFQIYTDEKTKVADFLNHKLDVINDIGELGLNQIFEQQKDAFNQIPPKMIYTNSTLLNTTLILFNLNKPIFESASNRKLFNYAINRVEINRELIHNQISSSSVYGLIPPMNKLFNHYDYQQLSKESLNYNPSLVKQKAHELKAYENDTLSLVVLDNPQRIKLGNVLKRQIKKELNINIRVLPMRAEDLLMSIDKMDADLYLAGFSAEFLNPLSLMKHFYGASIPDSSNVSSTVNITRYKNWYYDQFFEKASKEIKSINQFNAILLAEKELLKNPPFIVLYYNSDNYVQYSYVCNLYNNMLNFISFREVYIKNSTLWQKKYFLSF